MSCLGRRSTLTDGDPSKTIFWVTRMAASLGPPLDDLDNASLGPAALVPAHVNALRAVVRERRRTNDAGVAERVVAELEQQTALCAFAARIRVHAPTSATGRSASG